MAVLRIKVCDTAPKGLAERIDALVSDLEIADQERETITEARRVMAQQRLDCERIVTAECEMRAAWTARGYSTWFEFVSAHDKFRDDLAALKRLAKAARAPKRKRR